ncbi:hypothetical protein FVE85_3144 [Porphyridium purpureum]|uniref:Uncharacterized protein n=1 Tax=Porphyridium purpureum TaxID=35688 RepID=A0A5J4YVZ0_PORPP|nr:hypothetical protein FVE85_3144 [Porphyridium purpureum]|eukprot:POR8156..scf227_4
MATITSLATATLPVDETQPSPLPTLSPGKHNIYQSERAVPDWEQMRKKSLIETAAEHRLRDHSATTGSGFTASRSASRIPVMADIKKTSGGVRLLGGRTPRIRESLKCSLPAILELDDETTSASSSACATPITRQAKRQSSTMLMKEAVTPSQEAAAVMRAMQLEQRSSAQERLAAAAVRVENKGEARQPEE